MAVLFGESNRLIVISHRNHYDLQNADRAIAATLQCCMENIVPARLCWPTRSKEYGR